MEDLRITLRAPSSSVWMVNKQRQQHKNAKERNKHTSCIHHDVVRQECVVWGEPEPANQSPMVYLPTFSSSIFMVNARKSHGYYGKITTCHLSSLTSATNHKLDEGTRCWARIPKKFRAIRASPGKKTWSWSGETKTSNKIREQLWSQINLHTNE